MPGGIPSVGNGLGALPIYAGEGHGYVGMGGGGLAGVGPGIDGAYGGGYGDAAIGTAGGMEG